MASNPEPRNWRANIISLLGQLEGAGGPAHNGTWNMYNF